MTDYYKLLGVLPTSTTDEIKKAYRQLALKYHPDRNPEDSISEAYFKKVTEAYTILSDPEKRENYNWEYKKKQETSRNQSQQQKQTESNHGPLVTPQLILSIFQNIKKKVVGIEKSRINQSALFNSLNEMLSDSNINFLISRGDTIINKLIISEVMTCLKVLEYSYVEKISPKLAKLASSDNETIREIFNFSQKQKRKKFRKKHGLLFVLTAFVLILLLVVILKPHEPHVPRTYSKSHRPDNGDLNNTFLENQRSSEKNEPSYVAELTPEQKLQLEKDKLIAEGWKETEINNGLLPSCYNFVPKKSSIKNYLEVQVGGGTDVAIKVMNLNSGKCIRYVFINRGSTYKIRNIPEGTYYLKIAYGKDWFSKVENGQCIGKFLINPMYEKGDDIMNFDLQHTPDGYKIPSFQLKLDVISTDRMNTFSSQDISESEFNQ
jgi:hypothetical protein